MNVLHAAILNETQNHTAEAKKDLYFLVNACNLWMVIPLILKKLLPFTSHYIQSFMKAVNLSSKSIDVFEIYP